MGFCQVLFIWSGEEREMVFARYVSQHLWRNSRSMEIASDEVLNYLTWYNQLDIKFKDYLSSIGAECRANHIFFKYEILDLAGWLDLYKLKLCPELFEICIDRYISLIPISLHTQIERKLLLESRMYRAWFFNRHCFLKTLEDILLNNDNLAPYIKWSPVIDNTSPEECKILNGKILDLRDESTLNLVDEHWDKIKIGCRCDVLHISRYKQLKLGLKAP